MGQVRAKFRCMEISRCWNGECTIVRFLPVMAKNGAWKDDPAASAENARFWHATPSGEAKLTFKTLGPVEYELGASYYIDMEPAEAGDWQLRKRSHTEHQQDIELAQSWSSEVKMSIVNQDAWAAFEGKLGASWKVTFTGA